ncbi:MAG: hypothetical protein ABIA21_00780 [Candidatus Aenigmatarchaeota archaeon]
MPTYFLKPDRRGDICLPDMLRDTHLGFYKCTTDDGLRYLSVSNSSDECIYIDRTGKLRLSETLLKYLFRPRSFVLIVYSGTPDPDAEMEFWGKRAFRRFLKESSSVELLEFAGEMGL